MLCNAESQPGAYSSRPKARIDKYGAVGQSHDSQYAMTMLYECRIALSIIHAKPSVISFAIHNVF